MSAMSGLRPETCAKLAASLASCLAVACENMANQDRWGRGCCTVERGVQAGRHAVMHWANHGIPI
jgi:hypothetical protein